MNQKLSRFAFVNDDEARWMIRPSSERVTPSPGNKVLRELREARIARETPVSPGMRILLELRAKRRQASQDQGYANLSPGQKILFELRARRGQRGSSGYGFANEPGESGGEFSLTPHQQADVHVLAQRLGSQGGEATVNTITPSGKWREQPPHVEGSEHRTRLAEAVANAVRSGAMRAHPEKKKLGRTLYVPGKRFERFNKPMETPPPPRGYGGGTFKPPAEPPTAEAAKFIAKANLHPRQLADVQTLVQMMQNEGGRLSAGRIDDLRGKWRSNAPHVESDEYANRHEEARGLALKHGVFAPDPESEKYIPGPNYAHFVAKGQTPVAPKLEERNPSARRSAADRKENPTSPSQVYVPVGDREDREPTARTISDKIWRTDRELMQSLGKAFSDAAAKKGVDLPKNHDWPSMILHAVSLPGYESGVPLSRNDRDDAIILVGAKMIDAIRNYGQAKDGPFEDWAKTAIDHAGRTATDELRKETKGQIPRIRGISPTTSTEGEDGGVNPYEKPASPEKTDEERTVTRDHALMIVRHPKFWHNAKFAEAREAIKDRLGSDYYEIVKKVLLGIATPEQYVADSASRVGEKQAQALWRKFEASVVGILGQHFSPENPADGYMLDAIETVFGTPRMKANPIKMANLIHTAGRPGCPAFPAWVLDL